MPQPCSAGGRPAGAFAPATLASARPCPARPEYVELRFTTPEGPWTWCFPRPRRQRRRPAAAIALTMGACGVQARRIRADGLGPALPGSSALPMILAGADVYVARTLLPTR